ncbi:hypothetical protein Scep_026800 [Stephania cephalantha]|uniref:Neprosin PEP catalytic domain-containing protein n=1 Tax=Stephania cephalantha TaxID=152367 RepID=A0AAP0EKU6_9MAGN
MKNIRNDIASHLVNERRRSFNRVARRSDDWVVENLDDSGRLSDASRSAHCLSVFAIARILRVERHSSLVTIAFADFNGIEDKGTGNWWLQVEGEGIGYWPKGLIPALNDGASIVMWGGVTYVKTVDSSYNLVDAPKLQDFNIDCSAIHHVSRHGGVDKLGVAILYGGPGGNLMSKLVSLPNKKTFHSGFHLVSSRLFAILILDQLGFMQPPEVWSPLASFVEVKKKSMSTLKDRRGNAKLLRTDGSNTKGKAPPEPKKKKPQIHLVQNPPKNP